MISPHANDALINFDIFDNMLKNIIPQIHKIRVFISELIFAVRVDFAKSKKKFRADSTYVFSWQNKCKTSKKPVLRNSQ